MLFGLDISHQMVDNQAMRCLILLALLTYSSVFAQDYSQPRLFIATYDTSRLFGWQATEDLAGYRVQVIDIPKGDAPDAFEVTLRYVGPGGKTWSRTQTISEDRNGFFNSYFWVGRGTSVLSSSFRSIQWESIRESLPRATRPPLRP
jgi:hypothetical protein